MASVPFDEVWGDPFASGRSGARRRAASPVASDSDSDGESPRGARPVARNTARAFLAAGQTMAEESAARAPPERPRAQLAQPVEDARPAEASRPGLPGAEAELLRTLHDLQQELERLRKQNNQRCRSSILAVTVVAILIVIVLVFCVQAYRQLRSSTDYLAWAIDTRMSATPVFRA